MFPAALNFPLMDHIWHNDILERPLGKRRLMRICILDSYTLTVAPLNSNNMDAPLDQHDAENSETLMEVDQVAEISKLLILVMK